MIFSPCIRKVSLHEALISISGVFAWNKGNQFRGRTRCLDGICSRPAHLEDGRFDFHPFPICINADKTVSLPEPKQPSPKLRSLADSYSFILALKRKYSIGIL